MKVYNQEKTQELYNPDLSLGQLREDKLFIRTEPAVVAVQEQGHYETVREYPNGGKDVRWVVDVPGVQAKEAQNIFEDIQVYVPYTAEQLERQKKSRRGVYIDAYRKYQAAINYGEFQRVPAVDYFMRRLRNKDWSAFGNIPSQLKYFAGECPFAESGLIENPM
jgi:hypothetical protein